MAYVSDSGRRREVAVRERAAGNGELIAIRGVPVGRASGEEKQTRELLENHFYESNAP